MTPTTWMYVPEITYHREELKMSTKKVSSYLDDLEMEINTIDQYLEVMAEEAEDLGPVSVIEESMHEIRALVLAIRSEIV